MNYKINPNIDKFLPYKEAILKSRGINDVEKYLNPKREYLLNPYLLDNIDICSHTIIKHVVLHNPIALIVDCDGDGIWSSAMIYNYLKALEPHCDITYFMHEGKQHGLEDIIDKIENSDVSFKLVIIPDASSNDYEYHRRLKENQIDVCVIDHHLAEKYSENAIVVNNQLSNNYSNKDLSGAGVTYKVLQVMDDILESNNCDNYLDLAAAAIVADVMKLDNLENRYIVSAGLSSLKNFGLKTFVEKQSFSIGDTLSPIGIGFYIAPIVNAIIRVGTEEEKDLLFRAFIDGDKKEESTKRGHKSGDMEIVAEKAFRIGTNCRNRQNKIMDIGQALVLDKIYSEGLDDYPIIYVALDDLEEKKIPSELTGLVAMRVCNTLNRPVLIGREGNDGYFKGSARGNNGCVIDNLKQFVFDSGLFDFCEGHAFAFGNSIKKENIHLFLEYGKDKLKDINISETSYEIDYEFTEKTLEGVNELASVVDSLKSIWGNNISEPKVAIKDITFNNDDINLMGANKDSVKIIKNSLPIIKFKDQDFTDKISNLTQIKMTAIGRLQMNEWNGNKTPQFIIEDYEIKNNKLDF